MKSSRSSSQLTNGGDAGGMVWLDETLAFSFLFLSFLDLLSSTGGRNIMCWRPWFGGHKVIHVVIPINTSWCLRCCIMTWRTSSLFLSLFSGSMFMYKGKEHHVLEAMVWGHEVIHVVIQVNTIWCLRCYSMTWQTSGHLFLWRPSTIPRRSLPPPSHKSTEDTYQFTEILYRFVNQLRVLGVILAYN